MIEHVSRKEHFVFTADNDKSITGGQPPPTVSDVPVPWEPRVNQHLEQCNVIMCGNEMSSLGKRMIMDRRDGKSLAVSFTYKSLSSNCGNYERNEQNKWDPQQA